MNKTTTAIIEEIQARGYEAAEARAEAWRAVQDAETRAEYTITGFESAELTAAEASLATATALCVAVAKEYAEIVRVTY